MTDDDKVRASIKGLGLSRLRLWWISRFGETVETEFLGDYYVRYVRWRGANYSIVTKMEEG